MSIREKLNQQVALRGTKSQFGKLSLDAPAEIEKLDAIALEYDVLIRYMSTGGETENRRSRPVLGRKPIKTK